MWNHVAAAIRALPLILVALTNCQVIPPLGTGRTEGLQRRVNKARLSNEDRMYLLVSGLAAGGVFNLEERAMICGEKEGWWTLTKGETGVVVDKLTPKGSSIFGIDVDPGNLLTLHRSGSGYYWTLAPIHKWREELVEIVSFESWNPPPGYQIAVLQVAEDQTRRVVMTPVSTCEWVHHRVKEGPPPPGLRAETDKCALPFFVQRRCKIKCEAVTEEQSSTSSATQKICNAAGVGWVVAEE